MYVEIGLGKQGRAIALIAAQARMVQASALGQPLDVGQYGIKRVHRHPAPAHVDADHSQGGADFDKHVSDAAGSVGCTDGVYFVDAGVCVFGSE